MPTLFEAYREDGLLLYDTRKITYGLLKSGYLSAVTNWPRLDLRSAQLDPGDPSSWTESAEADPILGFSVTGAVAPMVFISGRGCACGSSTSGNVTTFYFIAATTQTKFYYFDTMRDNGLITGMKHFREDGVLTFNTSQVPLNIAATATPPAPGPILYPGTTYRGTPYVGATGSIGPATPGGPPNRLIWVRVDLQAGQEYAAYTNFSRTAALGANPQNYPFLTAQQEGAYGVSGGIEFMFCIAARSTKLPQSRTPVQSYQLYIDVPTDRYPVALAIKTSSYPFPFN